MISIFVLMPIAYYPTFLRYHLPGTTDLNFFHFGWHTLTVGPWPSGPAWFLWVLLAFDSSCCRAVGAGTADAEGVRPADLFAARPAVDGVCRRFSTFSVVVYLPMRPGVRRRKLAGAGRLSAADPDQPHPALCRLFLRRRRHRRGRVFAPASSAENGENWPGAGWSGLRFAVLFYGAILALVYVHHNWVADFNSPPLAWRVGYGLAFATFSAAMAFAVSAFSCASPGPAGACSTRCGPRPTASTSCTTSSSSGCNMPSTIIPVPAIVKFAIVFVGTLSMSWGLTVMLRKIPFVARMI